MIAPTRRRPVFGFTIIELLVALTISAIVVSSLITFFIGQAQGSRLADTRLDVVQRARFTNDLLRREMSMAGAGMPNAQPMVVYAGPLDFVFSLDLTSRTPGDRLAVYQTPEAPVTETEGADSGSVTLPNGQSYPRSWYGGAPGLSGPAETIHYGFASLGGGRYALTRAVNGLPADTLLRNLEPIGSAAFFNYETFDENGLQAIGSGPIWHSAAVHGSPADTAESARTDSVKIVHVRFRLHVQGREPEDTVQREFALAIALKNAGLIQNSSCGDPPILGVVPTAQAFDSPLRVQIRWPPATDERGGERDVIQYTLYRREVSQTTAQPLASLPPDATLPNYLYTDTDVEPATTYIYMLGATDCTPSASTVAQAAPVTTPG